MHCDRTAQHGSLRRRNVAGLGDRRGIHSPVIHHHCQVCACGDDALRNAGCSVVVKHGDIHSNACSGIGGVLSDLHLAKSGDDGDGGIIIERTIRPSLGGSLAKGVQLHTVCGTHHTSGVDQSQNVVIDDSQGQCAHGLGPGHILVRICLRHAFVEQAAQGVAAGDLAQRPCRSAGSPGTHAQHRLGQADHGTQRLLLGGLLGKGGVAILVHIHADGRGDGVGTVANQTVGLSTDGATGADHRSGAARLIAVVAHIHPGTSQGDTHRREHAALGFHACDIGRAGNAGSFGIDTAAGVQKHVAAGCNVGIVSYDGLGFHDGHHTGKGEQRFGEAALIHRTDVYFAVGPQHSTPSAGQPGIAVHQDGGSGLTPSKGQGNIAEQLRAVEIHQCRCQCLDRPLACMDAAVKQNLRNGLLDDDKVWEVGGHASHHVHHARGLADGSNEIHHSGSIQRCTLSHHDTDSGSSLVQADTVFHLGLGQFIFRHGDGQCILVQNVRVLSFGQDKDVFTGNRSLDLHFRRLEDDGKAIGQQLFNGDLAGGFHQQIGQVCGYPPYGGHQVDCDIHSWIQNPAHHIIGEILGHKIDSGHIAKIDGALVFQSVGHGIQAITEMDVYPLPQGHRVQDFFHDVNRQIGQQPHYALGIQMQAVIRLINAFCIGDITQDVLAIVDILRRKAACQMQPVIAAVRILVDGHIQAEHIVEGTGGVQSDDVIAIAAGNDILAAVLHLILFQPVF